jgi:uncharacterized YigZ family protein
MERDEFLTIEGTSEGIYKEKGSKFLAFAFAVETEEEAKIRVDELKDRYHDARHHCYAYMFGVEMDVYRMNDDGEPSSTAGKPILGQIRSHNLTNILVVVVRYFGGTLLGTSGLIRAYKSATADALKNAKIIKQTVQVLYQLQFGYDLMSQVEKLLHEWNIRPDEKTFGEQCMYRIGIRKTQEEKMVDQLKQIPELKFNKIDDI